MVISYNLLLISYYIEYWHLLVVIKILIYTYLIIMLLVKNDIYE